MLIGGNVMIVSTWAADSSLLAPSPRKRRHGGVDFARILKMTGPSESSGSWQRLWEIFHAALDHEPSERAAFLEAACGGDADCRREVEELLAAHASDGVLDHPVTPASEPTRPAFLPGERLASRFRIVRLIGSGGMGTVYEAFDEDLRASVALKMLHPDMARNVEALERFRRELLLARRVTHPSACRLFDLFHHHDAAGAVAFLTMELLRGETLSQRLTRTGPLQEDEAYPIVEQIAQALSAAHRVGVIHRDLKSANVVLVPGEDGDPIRAVVTDFGLASLVSATAATGNGLTRSGQLLGTPAFMAPEQLEGGAVTVATDIYALGLVMYEMVTGAVPFARESPLQLAIKRLRQPPPPPRLQRTSLGAEWNATIVRCLEREPADRFATADAVVAALRPGSSSGRFFIPRRHRRRAIGWALAGGAAAALVGAVVAWRPNVAPNAAASALAFNERDWVLVGDFENRTGEAVLDDTIRFALERELNASQFVNVVPRERVADALLLMKRPADTAISGDVAREVAVRDGQVRALVRGRIDKLGDTYLTAAELVDPVSGAVVASFAQEARGQQAILGAVRQLSIEMRAAVGEELSRIQQTAPTLSKVTTHSLRALQLYSRADDVIAYGGGGGGTGGGRGGGDGRGGRGRNATAEELLEQAIAVDPEFASAYIHLAHAITNQGRVDAALPYATRAMQLAENVGEGERQFIRGGFFSMSGDYEKALASYDALVQLYPDHFWGTNNAGMMLSFALLRGEEAVPYFVRAAHLRPNDFRINRAMAWNIAVRGNDFAAARTAIERARALLTPEIAARFGPFAAWVEVLPAYERWLAGDVRGAAQELARIEQRLDAYAARPALANHLMLASQALGRLDDGRRLMGMSPLSVREFVIGFLRNDADVLNRWKALDAIPAAAQAEFGVIGPVLLARVGLNHLAHAAALQSPPSGPGPPFMGRGPAAATLIVRGELALAAGKIDEGVALIQQGLPEQRLLGSSLYFLGSESLAIAWLRQKKPELAIRVLEDALRQRGRIISGSGAFWLRDAWLLAKVYRQSDRNQDAEKLEAELRQLLAVADRDHPILVEMQRAGVGTPAP
jgi:tetratricopeptide (TPR) repeat protein